ncbi:MAG: di-trans,poly-cis-decaprenylcistransferase [Clostridia bacterium]|nr:di-trans,poly-cis-decaprenylcistransferase [Clostridia bacterium]
MADCPVKHIAFIMDGNGRWAKKRLMPREYGHKAGAEAFERVVEYCRQIGIKYVTVYAFSTENWKRPKKEVEALFSLFTYYIDNSAQKLAKKNVRIVFIGDRSPFSDSLKKKMEEVEKRTENNEAILFAGINYGGRDEICHAVNELIAEGKKEINASDISAHVYTRLAPDPDLIVRTAGEYRLSNFMLWQAAYSELYVTDTLWPDMSEKDVDAAVEEFRRRNRRYGGI